MATDDDVKEAIDFLNEANDAESANRALAILDLKFRYGEQWPQYAIASRGLDRPQLTINEMDGYIQQVTNNQRQQRPRIKVQPVDDKADPKIAKVITGLMRHIETNSDADNAYDTAFDFAATMGWGYFRLRADFIDERSFDQDIYIDTIDNPFCVYFDPFSRLPDGSDQERCLITDLMQLEAFKKEFPGAQGGDFTERGTGDNDADWRTKTDIRLGEFFKIERKKADLVLLSDGSKAWGDDSLKAYLSATPSITVTGTRKSFKRTVTWRKQTAFEILERKELPGRWIPVIPVYWTNVRIEGKMLRQGLVRPGMDPQRMVNYWQSCITESIALAPKAKWLIPEGGDEGHEIEFKNANLSANPTLHYKTTGVDGKEIPAPVRLQPEPPPAGSVEAAFLANQNLQRVMGIFDPAVRSQEPKSGKAINAERSQSENSNYHGYDNLTRSLKHAGRIALSWVPTIYDTPGRVQRIIGEDGTPDLVTLNEKQQGQDETGQAINKILNDLTVGTYDVVMDTGPGYNTKRIEGVDAMMQLMGTPVGEKVAQVGDDLLVRQMDFPGADVLADRLAAANPLSQIDEKSDIPPKVQMAIKSLQQNLEQAAQEIQGLQAELKYRTNIEQMKQAGETQRAHMAATVKAHDTNEWVKQDSAESEKDNQTKILVEEIKAHVALLLARIDERSAEKASADADLSAVE